MTALLKRNATSSAESGHVSILALDSLRPARINDQIYRPIDESDPDFLALAENIQGQGVLEPIVVTTDRVILSGHRRFAACRYVGLKLVPCRFMGISSTDPDFVAMLIAFNRQRVKGRDEQLREEVALADPEESHRLLVEHRRKAARINLATIPVEGKKRRAAISKAKMPFLEAVLRILKDREVFLPLTDRQIHYYLLNDPPLRHASKPKSIYCNELRSYKDLTNLLTRARIKGLIPWEAIHDPTRPTTIWECHRSIAGFLRQETDDLLKGFYRDLMQSQPCHIEIVAEKQTLESVLRPVAMKYCIPLNVGRGYSSIVLRRDLEQRFRHSGKERLVLLMLSDHDPEGEDIAHSFVRSLRDDFRLENASAVKVALTAQQVQELKLPPIMTAKKGSSRRKKFVEKHGETVHELEAVEPGDLQRILQTAIDSVIDIPTFNAEVDAEKQDAAYLTTVRRTLLDTMKGII